MGDQRSVATLHSPSHALQGAMRSSHSRRHGCLSNWRPLTHSRGTIQYPCGLTNGVSTLVLVGVQAPRDSTSKTFFLCLRTGSYIGRTGGTRIRLGSRTASEVTQLRAFATMAPFSLNQVAITELGKYMNSAELAKSTEESVLV